MQGGIGVGYAVSHFMSKEIPVFVPMGDYPDYDLVVDMGGLKKVQVRTSGFLNARGKYGVNMRVFGGNAKGNRLHRSGVDMIYDYLFVYLLNGDKYLIPKEDIAHIKNQLVISSKHDKYKIG